MTLMLSAALVLHSGSNNFKSHFTQWVKSMSYTMDEYKFSKITIKTVDLKIKPRQPKLGLLLPSDQQDIFLGLTFMSN